MSDYSDTEVIQKPVIQIRFYGGVRWWFGQNAKRVFDLIVSVVLLFFLFPLFAVVFAIIKAEGGNVFFTQMRVGRHGEKFRCIKFRTMRPDAERILAQWKSANSQEYREYIASNFKLKNDPRVTGVGRFLRRTSLDELPQLLNVFLGEMSLVGPRPLLPRETSHYGSPLMLYCQVRPGITGLWQVSGRSNTTFADRAAADKRYISAWSFWFDAIILMKTVGVLLNRDGAY